MKHNPDLHEGPDAYRRFRKAVKKILAVPKQQVLPASDTAKKKKKKKKKNGARQAPAKRRT